MDDECFRHVIAVTGTIGSGKSTVCALFRSLGATVLDADEFAREAVRPGTTTLHEIAKVFGPDYLRPDGSLDRSRLGTLVFSSPEAKQRLEAIVHPEVRRLAQAAAMSAKSNGARLVVYDCPLFFEAGMDRLPFRAVIVVSATDSTVRARIQERNNLSETDVQNRIASQIDISEKERRADIVILNNGTLDELKSAVGEIYEQLTA